MNAAVVDAGVTGGDAPAWPAGLPAAPEPPAVDEAPGFAPAEPLDYRLPDMGEVTLDAVEADKSARSLMSAAGLPAEIGSFIAGRVAELSDTTGGPDDAQYFLRWTATRETLAKMWGAEAFSGRMAALRELVADTDRRTQGAATRFLDDHAGVLLDPLTVSQLLLHAERWQAGRRR